MLYCIYFCVVNSRCRLELVALSFRDHLNRTFGQAFFANECGRWLITYIYNGMVLTLDARFLGTLILIRQDRTKKVSLSHMASSFCLKY
jgi:hypothetical protein